MLKNLKEFSQEFMDEALKNPSQNLNELKNKLSKKYSIGYIPKNTEILACIPSHKIREMVSVLNIKPTREISGVNVVALFAKPHKCPHGKCIYCPGGPGSNFGEVPQSYTGDEPATMRGVLNNYDPYLQVFNRLEHYVMNGHRPDKIEAIVMGGTFPSLEKDYKDEFIMYMYKAFNDFGELFIKSSEGEKEIDYETFISFFELPCKLNDKDRIKRIQEKILQLKERDKKDYKKEIKRNETAALRCIGLTIETRPDWAVEKHCSELLEYGVTRFEIGVQSLYEDVLEKVGRGHGVEETARSFRIARDMCLKINSHMMIGLPGSDKERDINGLKTLFEDERFRPDMLKIYPCLLLRGTYLYDMYRNGEYQPISTDEAADIISESFRHIPRYTRVMRIQRDVPTTKVEEGVKSSNLRQLVERRMMDKGISSIDIRERESGFRKRKGYEDGRFSISTLEYNASAGREFFISVEDDNETLVGFVRLRFPSSFNLRPEIKKNTALIRELHVYGSMVPVGLDGEVQHKGWGRQLMEKAEEIAANEGYSKMIVIAGVGVREYYRKLGYYREGPYVAKKLL